jgi:energy-coupling factor transport system permease protein
MLVAGLAVAAAGFVMSGARIRRTRYRPDPWRLAEWGVAASGLLVAVVLFVTSSVDPAQLNPTLQPLQWPALPLIPTLAVLVGALPAIIAPPPVRLASPVAAGGDVDLRDRDPGVVAHGADRVRDLRGTVAR